MSRRTRNDHFTCTSFTRGYHGTCEDRVDAFRVDSDHLLIAVADGVGGRPGGAEAAQEVISFAEDLRSTELHQFTPSDWKETLYQLDRHLLDLADAGQTTVVLALLGPQTVEGVSAGDSELRLFGERETTRITRHQRRKPFPGSGKSIPIPFRIPHEQQPLLAATDGLWKYTSESDLRSVMRSSQPDAPKLVERVQLPSGDLQDDVGLVLMEPRTENV